MLIRIVFIFLLSNGLLAQNDTIDSSKVIISKVDISNVMHYSGYYKGLRSNGHIVSDTNGKMIQKSMYCASFDDSTIFYYRLTKYFPNQEIMYDSIIDFTKRRIAQTMVISKYSNGKTRYSIKLKAKLNQKRNDIPLRSETFWNGRESYFNEQGERTKNRIKNETR